VSRARACIAAIRAQGVEGYVAGTTLFGPAFVGLRATLLDRVVITDIWVSPSVRGSGHGQRILNICIESADIHGVTLQVRPSAFDRKSGDMDTRKLRAWYARNQFCTVDGSELLRRGPQPLQPSKGVAAQ
jgi:ribosomal protein S18 acetylase RimI-like enzyme